MNWIEEANKENQSINQIMSFNDYMSFYNENTKQQCRPTFHYLADMFEYFGRDEQGNFKLFQREHPDSPQIHGQHIPQKKIFDNLKNFEAEGINNKFILLIGPNGSSKSSLVRKIMKSAEEYSETNDGKLFTFSWVFPIDNFVKGTLGLTSKPSEKDLVTYAYLEDKDISAILPSELKDHPLLLIPIKYRKKMIEESLKDDPTLLESIKKSYLYRGDLSKRNRMIYDALLRNYKGDHSEVLKHIRVERLTISRRYSTGAVTIEPQLHVDARMQQITMDKRLGSLPPSLQSLNLFSLQGEVILANRGMLEFSDLLKRPLDAFKYLLMTMESANINLNGILTELDIFFIGTSNEIHLEAFKQHPDYKSFKGRFNFIKVPYLLNYAQEKEIYHDQVKGLSKFSSFEPHALDTLCLFGVMTRLRASQKNNFIDNKKLGEIITSINPLEKALLIAEKKAPDRLPIESQQILKHSFDEIIKEYESDPVYEGKFGISPRELKKCIYKITSLNKVVTIVEIFEYLDKFIQKRSEYDFLNIQPQGDYHNPARVITLLKDYMLEIVDKEIRDSLGLVDNRSYEDYIRRYIQNINAQLKGEKIKNEITGKFESCDEHFITEFEKNISLKETAKEFRSQLISQLGAYYLDNPNKDIIYCEVLPQVAERLKESFREEQNNLIKSIANNIVFYESEMVQDKNSDESNDTPLTEKGRTEIKNVLFRMEEKYGYSKEGAIEVLKHVIKNKY
jgi:predicted Ser/Thr protein kinase